MLLIVKFILINNHLQLKEYLEKRELFDKQSKKSR